MVINFEWCLIGATAVWVSWLGNLLRKQERIHNFSSSGREQGSCRREKKSPTCLNTPNNVKEQQRKQTKYLQDPNGGNSPGFINSTALNRLQRWPLATTALSQWPQRNVFLLRGQQAQLEMLPFIFWARTVCSVLHGTRTGTSKWCGVLRLQTVSTWPNHCRVWSHFNQGCLQFLCTTSLLKPVTTMTRLGPGICDLLPNF